MILNRPKVVRHEGRRGAAAWIQSFLSRSPLTRDHRLLDPRINFQETLVGILRTAAVLGAGYFLYKKYGASIATQSPPWEDAAPVGAAGADSTEAEPESTFGDRVDSAEPKGPTAGQH